jgi:hypothetical protein
VTDEVRRASAGAKGTYVSLTATIQVLFLTLAVLVGVDILARRLSTAPSIILLIAGGGLAFLPVLPQVERKHSACALL